MTWSWEWEENGAGLRASTRALGLALLVSGWACSGDTRVMGRQGAAIAGQGNLGSRPPAAALLPLMGPLH